MSSRTIRINGNAEMTETRKDELLSRFGYEIGNQVTIERTGQAAIVTGAIVIAPNFSSFGLGTAGTSTVYIQNETEGGTDMRVDYTEITHRQVENGMSLMDFMPV